MNAHFRCDNEAQIVILRHLFNKVEISTNYCILYNYFLIESYILFNTNMISTIFHTFFISLF